MEKLRVLRIVIYAALLFMFPAFITSCGAQEANNYYIGQIDSRVGGMGGVAVTLTMDYRKFFWDNTVYNQNIAKASILNFAEGLASLGFANIVRTDVGLIDNDRTGLVLGHRRVVYNGHVREVIRVLITGYTPGDMFEGGWSSNFDWGADTPEYFALTGSYHPEWTNRYNHKGFDIAANRVIEEIKTYIEALGSDAQIVLWISGASRGGQISNLVGAYFERCPDTIPFTYAFASSGVTMSPTARQYQTIFNIINTDDMTTMMPPPEWGAARLGTDLSASVAAYGQEIFRRMTGSGYTYHADAALILLAHEEFVPGLLSSRESLYLFHDSIYFSSEDFLRRDSAEAEKRRLEEMLRPEIRQFLRFYIYEGDGNEGYRVVIYYTAAAVMQSLAYVLAGGNPDNLIVPDQFAGWFYDFISAYMLGGLGHPHSVTAYYIVVRYLLP